MRREAASLLSWSAFDLLRLSTWVRAAGGGRSFLRRSISLRTGPFWNSISALARSASAWRRSDALFGVGAILSALLFDLMAEVVEFGLGVAGLIDLLGAIEDGDEVAFLDSGAVGDELGERHGAALAPDLGDEDFGGMDGFDGAGDADFALDASPEGLGAAAWVTGGVGREQATSTGQR